MKRQDKLTGESFHPKRSNQVFSVIKQTPFYFFPVGIIQATGYSEKELNKKPLIGIAHSAADDPEFVIDSIIFGFAEKGGVATTLEIFVIGGVLPVESNPFGSMDEQLQLISLSKKHPIRGLMFNLIEGENSWLDVVVTPRGVYFKKMELNTPAVKQEEVFLPLEDFEETGTFMSELKCHNP